MTDMKAPCVCVLLIASVSSVAGPVPRKCSIRVIDSEGAVVGKAHLFVHRDPSATASIPDRILDADTQGRLELILPESFYDVCVMSAAFTPQCRKVLVRDHHIELKFVLSASPEVLEEQGDRFPTR